jgi:soluble lytic murein transglycosylase-like protein
MKNPNFPMLAVLLALFCMLGQRAHAGAVYRCSGPDGQTAFTNKPGSFSGCTKISEYADAPAPKPVAAKSLPPKPPAPKLSESVATDKPTTSAALAVNDQAAVDKNLIADKPAVASDAAATPKPRNEYKSEPPSPFANVIGGASLNGFEQKPVITQNVTEKVDKSTEVRRGAVYKVARANGITEYTNVRPSGGPYQLLFTYIATCYACDIHSAINFAAVALNLTAYRDEIAAAAAEFGVDQALLRAVIHAESAFNPNAISVKGAQGLMQLMPATASDLGVASPFDGAQNIRGGAHYLAMLLRQFNGDERLAAAAYNSGAQNVQRSTV